MKFFALLAFIIVLISAGGGCFAGEYVIDEQFDHLEGWVPVTFPKIEKHTEYEVVKAKNSSILVARSDGSASGIRCTTEFNVYEYPVVRWRWKVSNIFKQGDVEKKSGDDYPLRVYIMFKYNPDEASFVEKTKYGLAKMLYGEYPPQSSLNYVWANRTHEKRVYPSAYTDRSQLIILRAGESEAGKWIDEQVNIIDDYQQAFGSKPPETASIAIMNDSDNTGEAAESYMDYIQVLYSE